MMRCLVKGGLSVVLLSVWTASAAEITVDWDTEIGPVKPIHGIGQPPMVWDKGKYAMMHYLKEAGIPYSRLHDVGGWLGGGLYVDIPNIFPKFEADENDPANYDFEFTDFLLKSLKENGVEPFYRLGITIENFAHWGFRPRRTAPPPDYKKWARICEHVIRHYNEGWANGFKMNIRHWEIWNEPEGGPCLFNAPFDEFIKFYGVTATYLKTKFPDLQIGGYGAVGFYAAVDGEITPVAAAPRGRKFYLECAQKFIRGAQEGNFPLDFFSFHSYSDPKEADRQVRYADWLLTKHGFTREKTKRVFDEWLCRGGLKSLGTASQAAGCAEELLRLQNGPCDMAMVYDGRCREGTYSALFNPMTYGPHKAYYAFKAFNELYRLGTAVKCSCDHPIMQCAAAKGPGGRAVMISNFNTGLKLPLKLKDADRATVWVTDETRTWKQCPFPEEAPLASFLLVKWDK